MNSGSWRASFRERRRKIYEKLFSSAALCIAGLLIMPSLLFNPSTTTRILQFILFWFLAWLAGKRNNPLFTILVMIFIIAFNLLVPYGRVIVTLGPFRLTWGALFGGLHRAVTLEGLIMLSKITIRRDLILPGAFGELIGESFRIFALITERRGTITRKNIAGSIDALLIELSENPPDALGGEPSLHPENGLKREKPARSPLGYIILAGFVLLAWAPVFYPVIRGRG